MLVADRLELEIFNDTAARYKFTNGTGELVDAIAQDGGFDVELNTSVASVQQSDAGVVVTTTNGDVVHAKRAVVTVPLNLLNSVSFDPPLSAAKQEASTLKHVGGGYKVFFEVEGDPGAVMTLSRSTDSPLIGSFTYKRGEQHSVLAGFSLEPGALDKSVDEWQPFLKNFFQASSCCPPLVTTGGRCLVSGSWCTYRPGTIAKFANACLNRRAILCLLPATMPKPGVALLRERSPAVPQQRWASPRAFRNDISLDGTKRTFSGCSVHFRCQFLGRTFCYG